MGMKARSGSSRHVALVRGINVGGHRTVPMADLREIFSGAGALEVETYIQSGNVVFAAASATVARILSRVADALESRFGFRPSLMTRSHEELASVVRAHPFKSRGEAKTLHVGFLASAPTNGLADSDLERIAPDEARLLGRELYLFCPEGLGRSNINKTFLGRLGTECTVRNWRTVNKLVELSASSPR